jgi:signal transduction histidine kinase
MTKSPTLRLLFGLLITLAAVSGFSSYTLYQLRGLRLLQTNTIDLNRHDSLLLLRVESDLNRFGLGLRDMTRTSQTEDVSKYREEFQKLDTDLQESLDEEEKLTLSFRRHGQHAELIKALKQFWQNCDEVFSAANTGHAEAARKMASTNLYAQQADLAAMVANLLVRNNVAEERADQKVASIYEGVERDIYAFLSATILAILITSLYLIYSNRAIFDRMESLSRQRRVLAARLISLQEEVLRSVSRELHDEFGQILTAVSAMLSRAEKKGVPADSPLRTELSEVREITHNTLEKMRSLSQMLHPAVIDDYGLTKGIEWYVGVFEKQTGIETRAVVSGEQVSVIGQPATHAFRIVQEALNNAAKHSKSSTALVEMIFSDDNLMINVKDFGRGLPPAKKDKEKGKHGLGLIAMRERAELLGGRIDVHSAPGNGTTVSLTMPLRPGGRALHTIDNEELLEEAVSRA